MFSTRLYLLRNWNSLSKGVSMSPEFLLRVVGSIVFHAYICVCVVFVFHICFKSCHNIFIQYASATKCLNRIVTKIYLIIIQQYIYYVSLVDFHLVLLQMHNNAFSPINRLLNLVRKICNLYGRYILKINFLTSLRVGVDTVIELLVI